ncbi:MAG: hypothetical protein AVDCRST_MAG79-222, partial [uncultured Thermoleophilia bacterium]
DAHGRRPPAVRLDPERLPPRGAGRRAARPGRQGGPRRGRGLQRAEDRRVPVPGRRASVRLPDPRAV